MKRSAWIVLILVTLLPACWKMQLVDGWDADDDADGTDTDADSDVDGDADSDSDPFEDLEPGELVWATMFDEGAKDVAALTNDTAVVIGAQQMYLFDQDADPLWSETLCLPDEASSSSCEAMAVRGAIDSGYAVTGSFSGQVAFGPTADDPIVLASDDGNDHLFLARFEADGHPLWISAATGDAESSGGSMAADPDGGFVVCGVHGDGAVLGEGQVNETVLEADTEHNLAWIRFDDDGAFVSALPTGGTYGGTCGGLDVGPTGELLAAGSFTGEIVLGPGQPGETIVQSASPWGYDLDDAFVARFGGDDGMGWVLVVNGQYNNRVPGAIWRADGSFLASGWADGEAVIKLGDVQYDTIGGTGGEDAFIVCGDGDGVPSWVRYMAGPTTDLAKDAATTHDGAAVVIGLYQLSIALESGSDFDLELDASGISDMFLARYGEEGAVAWAIRAGGYGYTKGLAVDVATDSGVLALGTLTGASTFGPGEPNETLLDAGPGNQMSFLAKYVP